MTLPSYVMKNVVYSKRPRAEIEGEAVLTDPSHGLKLILKFGAVSKAHKTVLKRTDAIMGELLCETKEEPAFIRPILPIFPKARDEDGEEYESADETDFDLRSKPGPDPSPSRPEDPNLSMRQTPPTPTTFDRNSRPVRSSSSNNALFSKLLRGLRSDSEVGSSYSSRAHPQYVLSRAEGSWVSHLDFDGHRSALLGTFLHVALMIALIYLQVLEFGDRDC